MSFPDSIFVRNVRKKHGFTMMELLVSIAVIFILIGTAFVAFRSAKRAADRTDTMNALRQMMLGYSSYSSENRGRLMPGHIKSDEIANGQPFEGLKVRVPYGFELDPDDAASYVWRLAPFLDNAWKTYMVDYRSVSIETKLEIEYDYGKDTGVFGPGSLGPPSNLGIARVPSFGLNSIFVGGDSLHGPPGVPERAPWLNPSEDPFAATRLSQVKNPSRLIVFAPSHAQGVSDYPEEDGRASYAGVRLGYVEVRPPFLTSDIDFDDPDWNLVQWEYAETSHERFGELEMSDEFGVQGGIPIDRQGEMRLTAARLDGSAATYDINSFVLDPSIEAQHIMRAKQLIMSSWMPW